MLLQQKITALETKYKLNINKVLLNLNRNVGKYDIPFQETPAM